jgi:hypothetical protein
VGKLIELEANLLGFHPAAGKRFAADAAAKLQKPTQKSRRIKREAFWK